jgi:2-methylcitrate dehydratase PrpD
MDAKVSTPFALGVAITKRSVTLGDFTLEGLKNPAVLQVAQKVSGQVNPELKTQHSAIVEIKTIDGKCYALRVEHAYGHHSRPITKEDLVKKFRDCVSYSAKPLSKETVETLIDMINHLEDVQDISRITELLG